MNRRQFLKISLTSLVASAVVLHSPIALTKTLSASRRSDPESMACYWMMENVSPLCAVYVIKKYSFATTQGRIQDFFANFVKRQPELIKWIKANIKNKDADSHWNKMKEDVRYPGLDRYRKWNKMADHVITKFNLLGRKHSSKFFECDMKDLYREHYYT